MNLKKFIEKRTVAAANEKKYRASCYACLQPHFSCYCEHIKKFDPEIKFVILIHPIEHKRRVATGRMSHLCLSNSELIIGSDYSNNVKVNTILNDLNYQSVVLYPGKKSFNLSNHEASTAHLFNKNKKLAIFVIDGTWATARKTMRLSSNISALSQICFTPNTASKFRVRKQPSLNCYSTIEAVHQTIEMISPHTGLDLSARPHDNLLYVFNELVERQIMFANDAARNPRSTSYRKAKYRIIA
jgi:DTW domain-containing protein YfiP